jgi:hypothetical protein
MRVIPSKLVPAGAPPRGVKNWSEVEVEMVKLLPNHANSTQAYGPSGVNRIQFRIPAYTNCFMDNSRSFLSYRFQIAGTGTNSAHRLKLTDTPGAWVQRLVIKSSNGLVLEDISNYNVLKKVLTSMQTEEEASIDEGNHLSVSGTAEKVAIGALQESAPRSYVLKFDTGILSQHLSSYLPLHIMHKGTFAFDVEIFLAPVFDTLEYVTTAGAPTTVGGTYQLTDVAFNLCLLKVDESICKKYNQIACDESQRVVIPYTTYHNHQATVSSATQTVFISDNCTDLKRVYSVFHKNTNTGDANNPPFVFLGSTLSPAGNKLVAYNYRLGNKNVYNEDVQESHVVDIGGTPTEVGNNNISLNHFLNAHYKGAKPCCPAMYLAKRNLSDPTYGTNYGSQGCFALCPNFTYSEESNKGVVQGVSAGGLPITATFKFDSFVTGFTNNNFVEAGYSLVIQGGELSYVEHQLGEHSY